MNNNNNNTNIEKSVRENAVMIANENPNRSRSNTYKCKECNKEYDTFQALGGHRASHRSFKRNIAGDDSLPSELVLHVCKICKKGFESGQSLGGHMRKHWRKKADDNNGETVIADTFSSSSSSLTSVTIACSVVFEYDLNLTPVENEEIISGKSSYI